MRLQGARAVVMGGASGLGLAVTERLVELGAPLVVLYLRPPVASGVHESVPEDLAGSGLVVGTSARRRGIAWPEAGPRAAAALVLDAARHGEVAAFWLRFRGGSVVTGTRQSHLVSSLEERRGEEGGRGAFGEGIFANYVRRDIEFPPRGRNSSPATFLTFGRGLVVKAERCNAGRCSIESGFWMDVAPVNPMGASIGAGTRSGHPSTEKTLVDRPSRKPLIQWIELWVIAGPDAGLQKRLDLPETPVVRVGRNVDNDLVLTDPYVSRLHLELQTMPEGLVLVDRSSGGIFIGDWRVKEMYLVGPETLCRLGQSRLLLRQAIEGQAEGDPPTADPLSALLGTSTPMQELRTLLYKIAPVHETVLLMGETGAGKELVADAIISLSPRRDRPAVKLNCAALPRDLIESELFGVGRRVATGVDERPGKFELAHGGTVFLDEIGELPLDLQAKLLRVIETGEVQRVGGKETLQVDVRVIAATNRDLKEMVQAGGFRRDLYHRLDILPIKVPSLRERPSDIPLLARRFLQQFASAYGRSPLDISPASLERIEGYPWPGNVRELKNTIRRAAVYADGPVVEIDELLDWSRDPEPDPACQTLPSTLALPLRVQERRWILEALARHHGNVAKAARELEIGEATVRRARRELTEALASHHGDIDQTAQELGISHSLIRTVTSGTGPSMPLNLP